MLRKIISILCCTLLASRAFATIEMPTGDHFFLGVSPGLTWVTGNKTQTIFLEPDVEKTYTANNGNSNIPSGEIFLGWQKSFLALNQSLISQLGISVVEAGTAKLSGDIWEDADPDFDNFTYNYKINHTHVALKGRLVSNSDLAFQPYISGSIGVGFNNAHAYSSQAIVDGEIPAPPFNSNTTTTFIYTVGIGLQKALTTNLQVALGYEFADWGKTQLSAADGQTVNQGLTLNHLYANQLQLSLFYIF